MKLASLNFESSPHHTFWGQRSQPWQRWLASISLLAPLIYLGWIFQQSLQISQEIQILKAQISETGSTDVEKGFTKESVLTTSMKPAIGGLGKTSAAGLSDDTRRNLNTVIRQLNTPWQDLFNELERLTPSEVALISIEPDPRREKIRLQAEAKTLDALLTYAADLQYQGVFGRLSYTKYEINELDSNKPTRLNFELELRAPKRLEFIVTSPLTPSVSMLPPFVPGPVVTQ